MARMIAFLFIAALAVPGRPVLGQPPGWEDVSAIFQHRCINCHSALGASKGLRLDSYEAVLAGGADGAVVLPGDAPGSVLVRRIRGEIAPRMPFLSVPLPAEEVDVIIRWIDAGLPRDAAGR